MRVTLSVFIALNLMLSQDLMVVPKMEDLVAIALTQATVLRIVFQRIDSVALWIRGTAPNVAVARLIGTDNIQCVASLADTIARPCQVISSSNIVIFVMISIVETARLSCVHIGDLFDGERQNKMSCRLFWDSGRGFLLAHSK